MARSAELRSTRRTVLIAGAPNVVVAVLKLAAGFPAEGTPLARTLRQARGQAKGRQRRLISHVSDSPDTTVKAALFEDSAAIAGLVLAPAGLLLRQLTGSAVWDGSR